MRTITILIEEKGGITAVAVGVKKGQEATELEEHLCEALVQSVNDTLSELQRET